MLLCRACAAAPLLRVLLPSWLGVPRQGARWLATRAQRTAAQTAAAAKPGLPQFLELFGRLEAGLAGMKEANPGFAVRREGTALVIDTGREELRIVGDEATGCLSYSSPKVGHGGGLLTYKLNPLTGHWCCAADGHFLIELLTRELIFHRPGGLQGVPTW